MSLIIIAFKNAPIPIPELKAKDEALDNEIKKKTIGKKIWIFLIKTKKNVDLIFIEIYNRYPNKTSLDTNTIWQQVVTSLNEQSSIRETLPIGGGFISKRSVFENTLDSITKGTNTTGNSNSGVNETDC